MAATILDEGSDRDARGMYREGRRGIMSTTGRRRSGGYHSVVGREGEDEGPGVVPPSRKMRCELAGLVATATTGTSAADVP